MLTYSRLSKSPSILRSFTGLEVSEFDSLYNKVESKNEEYERKRLSRKGRKNEVGGRPFKLELRDRLLMLLAYYRLYVTSTLLGFLFDLGQTNVLKDIRKLEPLVKGCIPLPEKLYGRAKRAGTPEEVEQYFPGFMAFIDATEQEIPRPKNSTRRKSHYSGIKTHIRLLTLSVGCFLPFLRGAERGRWPQSVKNSEFLSHVGCRSIQTRGRIPY